MRKRTQRCAPASMLVLLTGLVMIFGPAVSTSRAQLTRATISGVVTDPTGAAIPGATVTATNTGTSEKRTAVSGAGGNYTLTELDPGDYFITVTAPGFATLQERGIKVDVAARLGMDFRLEIGKTSTTVEVTAAAPMVETTNSTISDVVSQEKVIDLPLNGRDVYALVSQEPGVMPGPAFVVNVYRPTACAKRLPITCWMAGTTMMSASPGGTPRSPWTTLPSIAFLPTTTPRSSAAAPGSSPTR